MRFFLLSFVRPTYALRTSLYAMMTVFVFLQELFIFFSFLLYSAPVGECVYAALLSPISRVRYRWFFFLEKFPISQTHLHQQVKTTGKKIASIFHIHIENSSKESKKTVQLYSLADITQNNNRRRKNMRTKNVDVDILTCIYR